VDGAIGLRLADKRQGFSSNLSWSFSVQLGSVKIAAKANDGQVVFCRSYILISIVEIQIEFLYHTNNMMGILWFKVYDANGSINESILHEP